MKFSVLLPTRNRLEYLKYAIYSVMKQDYEDWEIIVSDNFSEEDVFGYIQSLNDSRIKYFRTASFVSVTENWNNSLDKCSGDYVIMLGDDDSLMRGYFTTFFKLITEYSSPDFIYTSAFHYAYPDVMPQSPQGYLMDLGNVNASFLLGREGPFWLDRTEAVALAKLSLNFKMKFSYNMQFALINKRFIDSILKNGPFFQSPYPDYYAMTVMMLKAERILAYPASTVAIGISPKSFGFYFFNQREKQGEKFLNHAVEIGEDKEIRRHLMTGTEMNTAWLLAMLKVSKNYKEEFDLDVNVNRYRLLQMVHFYKNFTLSEKIQFSELKSFWRQIRFREKVFYGIGFLVLSLVLRRLSPPVRSKSVHRLVLLIGAHPEARCRHVEGGYRTIQDVFDQVNPTHLYSRNSTS